MISDLTEKMKVYTMGGMTIEEKHKLWKSLRRIEGQVGGIGKMVQDDKDCGDILIQINAAMSALKSVGRGLLVEEASLCTKTEAGKGKYDNLLKRFI